METLIMSLSSWVVRTRGRDAFVHIIAQNGFPGKRGRKWTASGYWRKIGVTLHASLVIAS
jgi:hypothetical protein